MRMSIHPQEPMRLDDLEAVKLNAGEAFLALGLYLERYAERVEVEPALAILCADVQVEADKMSSDPAALSDWAECVQTVLQKRN